MRALWYVSIATTSWVACLGCSSNGAPSGGSAVTNPGRDARGETPESPAEASASLASRDGSNAAILPSSPDSGQSLGPGVDANTRDATSDVRRNVGDASALEFVESDDDGWGFRLSESRRAFVPMGVNYDHDDSLPPRLLEEYWTTEWDSVVSDFSEIAGMGFNTVRIHLQFGRFMLGPSEPNEAELLQLDRLVEHARSQGLYLDITGLAHYRREAIPAWFAELDDEAMIRAEEAFWRAVAGRYANEPAILCYDLQNEPMVNFADTQEIVGPAFADTGFHYVNRHFRDVSAYWATWLREGGSALDGGMPNSPTDIGYGEFLEFTDDLSRAWVSRMVAAVRSVDTKHLITIGFAPPSLPLFDFYYSFDPAIVGEFVDFVSTHVHPSIDADEDTTLEAAMALRGAFTGKTVLAEEFFPLVPTSTYDSFIESVHDGVAGWLGFYWGTTREQYAARGDIHGAIMAEYLDRMMSLPPPTNAIRQPGAVTLTPSRRELRASSTVRQGVQNLFQAALLQQQSVDIVIEP